MSVVLKLMIGGWVTTFVMIGVCALNQSGKLLRIHQRLGQWLETLVAPGLDSPAAAQRDGETAS
ncbi:MAG: hypothetical protein ACRD20_03165 [Terriglobales bacterium]